MYPEFEWNEWQFSQTTPGYWEDLDNQHRFMKWLAYEEGVETPGISISSSFTSSFEQRIG